jgi:hypothetical protein
MHIRKMLEAVKHLVALLVNNDFDTLERLDMLGPSTKEEYAKALQEFLHDGTLLENPPDDDFIDIDIYRANSKGFVVRFSLWVNHEPSDLSAIINVDEKPGHGEEVHATLYDLRVL